jgi:hypothetical protein
MEHRFLSTQKFAMKEANLGSCLGCLTGVVHHSEARSGGRDFLNLASGSNLLNGYVFWLGLCQLEGPDPPGLNFEAELAAALGDFCHFLPQQICFHCAAHGPSQA